MKNDVYRMSHGLIVCPTEDHEQTEKEEQANRFAADFLIPRDLLHAYLRRRRGPFSIAEVKEFAAQIGIAPGIVVGRLQHDNLVLPTHLNGLKRTLVEQS